jgi:hypothetical protein
MTPKLLEQVLLVVVAHLYSNQGGYRDSRRITSPVRGIPGGGYSIDYIFLSPSEADFSAFG